MQFELTREFLEEIIASITSEDKDLLLEKVGTLHSADIVEIIHELTLDHANFLYRCLDDETAADILTELDEERRDKLLSSLSSKEIAGQVDNLDSDDAVDVIGALSEEQKHEVIAHLEDRDQKEDIVDLLNYPEDSAGGLMAKEFIQVDLNWPVDYCIQNMRKQAEEIENIYTTYVTDEKDQLLGTLSLKKLLFADSTTTISDLYNPDIISVQAMTDEEEVARIMEKYDLIAMPVVDGMNRLIGRITIDDVVDVIKDEAEKDYQMASGLSEKVETSNSIWRISRARLPWLLIGLIGGVCGAQVIQNYEHDILINPSLAYFIPLIAAMGGNVGVQSSAIVVQGLANKSLSFDRIMPKLFKELSVALLNGVVCSVALFTFNRLVGNTIELATTVSLALFVVIIVAGIFGTLIPLILNRYKIDPALATGPFITTINDVLGLFIYFIIGRFTYLFF